MTGKAAKFNVGIICGFIKARKLVRVRNNLSRLLFRKLLLWPLRLMLIVNDKLIVFLVRTLRAEKVIIHIPLR